VRIEMAGICGTDVHLWLGQLPHSGAGDPGHETVADRDKSGPGLLPLGAATALREGDRSAGRVRSPAANATTAGKRTAYRCNFAQAYGISYRAEWKLHTCAAAMRR